MPVNATRIKQLRAENGLTVRVLAERTGFAPSYLSNLENGKKVRPRMAAIERIAEVYGVELDEIYTPAPASISPAATEPAAIDGEPLILSPEAASAKLNGLVSPEWLTRMAKARRISSVTIVGTKKVGFTEAQIRELVLPREAVFEAA